MQGDLSNTGKGRRGEIEACKYLEKEGFKVLELNFRSKIGEIDIIASRGKIIHFFEVKSRRGEDFGSPFEALTPRKRDKIKKTAGLYLLKNKGLEMPSLFGAIAVDLSTDPVGMECIIDAFD